MPKLTLYDEIALKFAEWAHLHSLTEENIKDINEIARSPKKHQNEILRCWDKLHEGRDIEYLKSRCIDRRMRMYSGYCRDHYFEIIRELYGIDGLKIALLNIAIRFLRSFSLAGGSPLGYEDYEKLSYITDKGEEEKYKEKREYGMFFADLKNLEEDHLETKDVREYFKKYFAEIKDIIRQSEENA